MHFDARSAFNLIDSRIPSPEELKKKYLLKLDKNSAYIAAAATEFYGMGTPVLSKAYEENAVAVWKVRVHSLADTPFPVVTRIYDQRKEEIWLAGPIVRLMRHLGYDLEILEGYIFREKYMLLKAWSKRIWDARISFRDDGKRWPFENSRKMAETACKMVAVATIGITGYGQFRRGEESDKERPDIKLITIARNYEIMMHNILKAWREDGILPVLVNMDCVYILTDSIDAGQAAPSYMLRNGQSREKVLGGYKREGWMEVTPEVVKVLTSADHAPQKKRALDKIGWK
jgi:hypothetical protein